MTTMLHHIGGESVGLSSKEVIQESRDYTLFPCRCKARPIPSTSPRGKGLVLDGDGNKWLDFALSW